MRIQRFLLLLILLISCPESFSQNFLLTVPKLEFDGNRLSITYDIVSKNQSDIFFVIVEMRNKNGMSIRAKTFNGDAGDSIKPGKDKKIVWIPEDDAIYLDDDVTVELKGERYEKMFNKSSMILMSAVVPGLGQTKIRKGQPWWLAGIPAYGALAGGFIVHKNYINTYNAYKTELDPTERADLLSKSQKQSKISNALFISAAAIWAANVVWVAATPNKYRPLQIRLSVSPVPDNMNRGTLLSLKVDF